MIYKHALIVPEGLDVTAESAPPEPALLWISRQVRAEARPIFYHENSFTIRGENRSVAPGLKWYKQHRLKLLSAKISVSSLNSHITPGRSLFDNLLEYIEAYYKDEIRFSPRQKSCAYPHPRLEKGAARHRFWFVHVEAVHLHMLKLV